jgi:uncharacterized repeat protein (TIGR01451 family)
MQIRLWMIVATLLLGSSGPTFGAINDWTAIGPSGGRITKIAFNKSTPSIVYAIATEGFYRSVDGGTTWQLNYSNLENSPSDLETDPSDATRVYVVSQNYPFLYASTDSGATMSPVTTLPTSSTGVWQVAVAHSGATLNVNSGAQIYYSSDRANTWTARTPVSTYVNAQVWRLVVDPNDANTLYAAATISETSEGTLVSHDGAMTWQLLASGDATNSYAGVAIDFAFNPTNSNQVWAARYDGVWVSNDKGATWTNALGNTSSAIAVDPSNPLVIYAGTPQGGVFRTADGGATWYDVTGNNISGQLLTVAVDPAQSVHVLLGGLNGLVGTTTSGNQWSTQTAGIYSTTILGLTADPAADRIYANVSSSGVYYSSAGAATTQAANNFGSGGLVQLSLQPTLNVTAILAQPGRLSASLWNGLARSADGGATWSLVPIAPSGTSNQMYSLASWPGNSQTILAASSTTLYRTTDGGDLWAEATNGLPSGAVVGSLVSAPSDSVTAYALVGGLSTSGSGANSGSGVYKTADAGATWSLVNADIASDQIDRLAVDPTNPLVVYAATESGLLKSIDGGSTWNALTWNASVSQGYPDVIAIDPKHPNILYAAREFIARSADGGATWQTLRASGVLPTWFPNALLLDPNRPENLLIATIWSGVQQFTVAPDLALTLSAPSSPVGVGVSTAYHYTVSNLGPFDATGVAVNVQLPTAAQSISATANNGTCTLAATVATCTFGVVATGTSNAITLNATAPAAGSFQLLASVAGDQPDPNSTNNTLSTAESIANLADLSVTVTGSGSAQVGGSVSYTAVVSNAGPDVAAAAQLTVQLAPGLTLVSATVGGTACSVSSSNLVTCPLGDLASAKSASATINASADTAGTQVSTATVSSTATDLTTSNNSAASSTTVTAAPTAPSAPTAPAAEASPAKGGGGSLTIDYLILLAAILMVRNPAIWARRG